MGKRGPKPGQIRYYRTYRDLYPTGRKYCYVCGRWRHLIDFYVTRWADEPLCTIARTLSARCKPCTSIYNAHRPGR